MDMIDGFETPAKVLSGVEKRTPITEDRISKFHTTVGEDLFDSTGVGTESTKIFGGYLIAKYPDYSADILNVVNSKYPHIQDYLDIEDLQGSPLDIYKYFAEFCNLTVALRERVNVILISVDEHYNL